MYVRLLKSLNRLNPRAWDFIQLTRMDKPIGIYLLLWPTLWALWVAAKGRAFAKQPADLCLRGNPDPCRRLCH